MANNNVKIMLFCSSHTFRSDVEYLFFSTINSPPNLINPKGVDNFKKSIMFVFALKTKNASQTL